MKLHRRTVRLAGRPHTVVSLRPGTAVRFSTNLFHETWHVLSDRHGARLLGRLLWGLSYQSRPGTLVVIDRGFITTTPFDGDPADRIVLVPAWDTPFTARHARALKARLPPASAPDGTVRWHTHGLDAALADPKAWLGANRDRDARVCGRVERLNGLVVLRPQSPHEMREWAVHCGRLDPHDHGMDYTYLGEGAHYASGEVQVFRSFRRDVSVARRARAEVLDELDEPVGAEVLRPLVWDRAEALKR
ncbi:hypothetical protein DZF91_14800 [Actinomadura logoneensis]|uniref:Uncharacterized protein n=2 Tax=Actinomadura logoneensis TaxID=2293572 RepID=A0A372JM84_9ACTN|nr:hypothetical protein DZF91_14800 [Actinomadura logoneensis]